MALNTSTIRREITVDTRDQRESGTQISTSIGNLLGGGWSGTPLLIVLPTDSESFGLSDAAESGVLVSLWSLVMYSCVAETLPLLPEETKSNLIQRTQRCR